jgi:branched-chain amino acid transport system ATP-binding protein
MLAVARILRTGAKPAAAGRNHRRPGAGDRQEAGRGDPRAQARAATPSCWWSRTSASPRPLADRHYVMEHGRIVATVQKDELASKTEMLHELLGV